MIEHFGTEMSARDRSGVEKRQAKVAQLDSLDINSPAFSPDKYVNSLIQRKGLDELVAVEEDMIMNVRGLDSEMQQLVYENYSKFISATNTVRSMQNTFAEMNDGLQGLSTRMQEIWDLSDSLTGIFSANRENVRRLGREYSAAKRLQRLIELPSKLETLIGEGKRREAVEVYLEVGAKFDKYRHINSIASLYDDCKQKVDKLRGELHSTLRESVLISEQHIDVQVEALQLLLKLGEDEEEELRRELTDGWKLDFDRKVGDLNRVLGEKRCDVLEFVESHVCRLLTALSLAVSSFQGIFSNDQSHQLTHFIRACVTLVVRVLDERFESDENGGECALYVRSLDKAVGKISALSRLSPDFDFAPLVSAMVMKAGERQVAHCRKSIRERVDSAFAEFGQKLKSGEIEASSLPLTASRLEQVYIVAVKKCLGTSGYVPYINLNRQCFDCLILANLLFFIALDTNFASLDPADFFTPFTQLVYSELVLGSLRDLTMRKQEEEEKEDVGGRSSISVRESLEHLVYAVVLDSILTKHLNYLLALSREQFKLADEQHSPDKSLNDLADDFKSGIQRSIQQSLRAYVHSEATRLIQIAECGVADEQNDDGGLQVSGTMKSRSERIHVVNGHLATLLDHSPQDTPAPSIRREGNGTQRSEAESAASSCDSTSMASTTVVERLWSEADDTEETLGSLELRRQALLITIVQEFLVRLLDEGAESGGEISQAEVQQLQIDVSFLKHYLLSHQMVTSCEHQLNSALESFISGALNRCVQPTLLEPAIAKKICDTALSK